MQASRAAIPSCFTRTLSSSFRLPLNHTARHEASNRRMTIFVVWPDNSPSDQVGYLHNGSIRHINPLAFKKDLEMTVVAAPVRITQHISIRQCTASFSSH